MIRIKKKIIIKVSTMDISRIMRSYGLYALVCGLLIISWSSLKAAGPDLDEDIKITRVASATMAMDTIPLQDRYGDFISSDYYNPFDVTPSVVEQTVEYDMETGMYIVMEKIGDQYYRTPTTLTLSEYLAWQQEKQQKEYQQRLSGIKPLDISGDLKLDPMADLDIEELMINKLFGGTDISIKPSGTIDLDVGFNTQILDGVNVTPNNRRQVTPDFDIDPNVSLEGKIGEKMNIGFNFDADATFDFDNKLNLDFLPDEYDEDGIIKAIEVGNVSFPLKSQLIDGTQDLFGFKTDLQFGHLRLSAVASQSRSQAKSISLENGKLIQEFELRPDDYDENRHFFISHYNRDNFNRAMSTIPQVRSLMRITNIEVWVSTLPNDVLQNATTVAAISYLGESDLREFSDPKTKFPPTTNGNPLYLDVDGNQLPDNDNSDLFRALVNDPDTRKIVNTTTKLSGPEYMMTPVRDFEVQSMRKLNSSEFTYYPELGFISLTSRLQPNQVLGVAYEYTYSLNGSEVYKVGELTNESNTGGLDQDNNPEPEDVIYVKMLKSSNQRVDLPSWDLMMKNIYSLSTAQLTEEDFELDIFFEDNKTATLKRFIPETPYDKVPLLDLFQLDRLNSRLDPQSDGVFDFVPGMTVNTRTGSIIFPVLEPFGQSLLDLLDNNQELYREYGFPDLYTESITDAREQLEKNRFVIKGQLKSNYSSEISLGAFNIPRGSVVVRAGSQILREGIDYDIDYGIGRIKILNDAYLQQGVPIKIDFEDKNLFGLQQKTMFGLRAEYDVSDNLVVGGTMMRLFERPFTQKVNIGDDPINNKMYGLDLNYTTDAPFLTNVLDKLPFYSTSTESSISLAAEVAAIKPGHSRRINVPGEKEAVVSLDDFEGATSSIPLGSSPARWTLASTPSNIRNSNRINDLRYNDQRALINWYLVNADGIRSEEDRRDPYTRRFRQTDLFQRQIPQGQLPDLWTFDVSYYPEERGPYNFNTRTVEPDANGELRLTRPTSSWAGIMRYIDSNNDFQATNIQYIEFWMLNPFMDRRDGEADENDDLGRIVFNLGNVSEDILKDNLQFYENGIPLEDENIPIQNTVWGNVPLTIPSVNAFDRTNADVQDLGLDGLSDDVERIQYSQYISEIQTNLGVVDVSSDPSNDNFVTYLDERYQNETNLLNRYKKFNNPQGNVSGNENRLGIGNVRPDTEDLNGNRSLDQSENYYEYIVSLANNNGEIQGASQSPYITDTRETINPETQQREKWYRFRIPVESPTDTVGNIQGFRSIQFLRMYFTGFRSAKTFRFAEFELVRSQWRTLPIDSTCLENRGAASVEHVIDEVGVEENSQRQPFNYVLPKGIKREQLVSTFNNIQQDENSMSIRVCNLPDSCDAMVYKLAEFDMRQYKRLQMFVHAEARDELLQDDDLSVFIRLGRDFKNNYYEYELPMKLSSLDSLAGIPNNPNSRDFSQNKRYIAEVWKDENMFDIPLKVLTDAKIARNLAGVSKVDPWRYVEGDPENSRARVTIKGNPTLGFVKGVVIGIRSKTGRERTLCAEVWFNELRLQGFNNRGGVAGVARMDVQLADLGNVTMSGNFSTIGFGQIDQQLQERSLDHLTEYDIATNLELGKFFPQKFGLKIPFYYQYNKSISQSEYDPYELDLKVDTLKAIEGYPEIEDIDDRSKERTTIKTVNFTNVRKEKTGGGKAMPWDISNVSVSYSHTETTYSDDILRQEKTTDQRSELNYGYSPKTKSIMPFKGIKSKPLRFIKEINFNPIPNSFSFNTELRKYNNRREYRLPNPAKEGVLYAFDDQRYNWDRFYTLQWDLTKSLKLNYDASASAVIDELRQTGVASTIEDRGWENEYGENVSDQVLNDPNLPDQYRRDNLRDFGRLKNYTQGVSVNYTLPFKYLPGLDWISARASYAGDYTWNAGSLSLRSLIEPEYEDTADPWHVIQNTQNRTLNATFSFKKLYDKVPYFKQLQSGRAPRARSRRSRDGDSNSKRGKKARELSTVEKIFVRPLLSLQEFKFTYRENLSTVVPGFGLTPKNFGLSGSSPGVGFVFGLQPDLDINNDGNWLKTAATNGWITPTRFQNQQVLQNSDQTLNAQLKVEPWRDFTVDVKFEKSYRRNHAEDFVNRAVPGSGLVDLQQVALRDLGSYKVTFFAMNTLFNDDINGLFKQFESYRAIISNRLPNQSNNPHSTDAGFAEGYGRQHVDVLIPSFLAAYTGADPELVNLNLTNDVARRNYIPKPNWNLRYNGLSKLPWFKDIFSNVSVTHGYTSTLAVNSYQTDLQYKADNPYLIDPDISTGNYFARFEIPELLLDERFDPIIGLDIKTKSDLTANLKYSRSRSLQLSSGLGQINQTVSKEITAGIGWILDDVNIPFLTGQRSNRSRSRSRRNNGEESRPEDDAPDAQQNNNAFQKKLQFTFDFSLRDDATYTLEFDSGRDAQATRGTYTLQISPSLDYDINKYFTLRLFLEYNQSKPKTLGGYDVTNYNGGLTARFNLQ